MCVIGIRVEPSGINWAVVGMRDGAPIVIANDKATAPATYNESQALSWYRKRVATLVDQYRPGRASVRYPETTAREGRNKTSAHRRYRIEGVVLEALHSASVAISTGPLRSISSRLGSTNAKRYLEQDDVRGLNFGTKSKEMKEAILVARSILEKSNGNQDAVDVSEAKADRRGPGSELDRFLG